MSQTRPWVLFVSLLLVLAAGFLAFCSWSELAGPFAGEPHTLIGGSVYVVNAAFYGACAYYLFLYGRRIGSFKQTDRIEDLEAALVAQKSFWKLVGIWIPLMVAVGLLLVAAFAVLVAVDGP